MGKKNYYQTLLEKVKMERSVLELFTQTVSVMKFTFNLFAL